MIRVLAAAALVLLGNLAAAFPTPPAPSPKNASKPTAPKTVVVEADGFGATRQEAIDQALLAAIMMEVGGILDSETLVENDRVIRDTMRQRSAGIVQRYEILKEEARDGGTAVRVRATVGREAVVSAAGEVKTGVAKVSGRSLLAKKKSMARAEQDIRSAVLEATGELLATPFRASLGEEALLNAIGMKLPESETGLVIPIVLAIDLERWNQQSNAMVERLAAIAEPIASDKFAIRPWSLSTPQGQKDMEALSKSLEGADPSAVQAAIASNAPAAVWARRLVTEAATPVIVARNAASSRESPVGQFYTAGFIGIPARNGVDALESNASGFTSHPDPEASVLGVVHAIEPTRATVSYFRVDAKILEAVRKARPSATTIEVALADAQGAEFESERLPLELRGPRGASVFMADGRRSFGSGTAAKAEDVLVLVPGRIQFGVTQSAFDPGTATLKEVRVGGTEGIDDSWFGMLATTFSESEIERAEEIRVRNARADATDRVQP